MSNKKNDLDFSLFDSVISYDQEVETKTPISINNLNSLTKAMFVVLDTETTGATTEDVVNKHGKVIKKKSKVVEIAYARLTPKGKVVGMTDRLYNPGETIPPIAVSVHNITDKMVADKPTVESEIEIVRKDIGGLPIIAYNANFDYCMLPYLQDHLWLDAYKMAMHVWHIGQLNEDGHPLTSLKQQELRFWLKLDDKYEITGEAHRADSDIQVTSYIFQEIRKHYLEVLKKPDDLDAFIEWVDSSPEYKTIPFGTMRCKENPETGEVGVKAEDLPVGYLKYLLSERNPMKPSFDKFGVTPYLMKPYVKKLAEAAGILYDQDLVSRVENLNSHEDILKVMTPEEIKEHTRHKEAVRMGESSKIDVSDKITSDMGLSDILNTIEYEEEASLEMSDHPFAGPSTGYRIEMAASSKTRRNQRPPAQSHSEKVKSRGKRM